MALNARVVPIDGNPFTFVEQAERRAKHGDQRRLADLRSLHKIQESLLPVRCDGVLRHLVDAGPAAYRSAAAT